jgi:phosphoenolpyruvate synthase/pyruvate phosphate dikinase
MEELLKWLPDAGGTTWQPLAEMMRKGLRVPAGYMVSNSTPEEQIRAAYEDLKIREKTHFIAVRGASHAVLNVIGPDALIHTFRRLTGESPEDLILIQRMVPAVWCGKAAWHRKNLRIAANEGMMLFDPDTYLVNTETGKCIRRTLVTKQRKMIRHVDGSAKVVERDGERLAMPGEHLARIAELAVKAGRDIGWAVDDLDKVWLLSVS